MAKIIFNNNSLSGLVSFRLDIAKHLLSNGHEVIFVAPPSSGNVSLQAIPDSIRVIQAPISPAGTNPFSDVKYFLFLLKLFKRERPDCVFNYTIKPNIYGALAAKFFGIRTICMMPGLGRAFDGQGFACKIVRRFYCFAVRKADQVLVLNSSDNAYLLNNSVICPEKLLWLKGGEGLDVYHYSCEKNYEDISPRFVMISRLIKDKGYGEFVAAAREIRKKYPEFQFDIVGNTAFRDPMGVQEDVLNDDINSGVISYLGLFSDIRDVLSKDGTVMVLPSYYHEGLNRSLMEAASMGCPLITTTQPGCIETVENGVNGFIVPTRDIDALVKAILKYISLNGIQRQQMSEASRRLACERFDVKDLFAVYDRLLAGER